MRIIIYLEGKSDQLCMEKLLNPLVQKKREKGISINFIGLKSQENRIGNNKKYLLAKIPLRAINILLNDPHSLVIVLPDLYPQNCDFPHETSTELKSGIEERFTFFLKQKKISDSRLLSRFKVFCFKHDLEVLLLAAEEELLSYLKPCKPNSWGQWKKPVEEQNNNIPPKRIVENLFKECRKKYKQTIDAPMILSIANYTNIAELCPQCFKPFVSFLENI